MITREIKITPDGLRLAASVLNELVQSYDPKRDTYPGDILDRALSKSTLLLEASLMLQKASLMSSESLVVYGGTQEP